MIFNRGNWPSHRPWLVFCVLATAAASVWFGTEAWGTAVWPSGSSLPGISFGVAGGLIIIFELLLWWRKKVRVWRIGRTQSWMRAHIWLGLLCVPLLILHTGFRFGGTLSTVLMGLLLVVVASGIWGLAMQHWLPSRMLDELPAETIYSQIDHLAGMLLAEGERLVRATCGPSPADNELQFSAAGASHGADDHIVVGAVRSVGRMQGKVVHAQSATSAVPDAEALRAFFHTTVAPFLQTADPHSPLHSPTKLKAVFESVRTKLPTAAHASLNVLEESCNQRRQWAQQARLHFWLHSWLWLHFPLSVALLVLMVAHVWVAIKFW